MQSKNLNQKSTPVILIAFVFLIASAFISKPGGDSFEIYLNSKLLVKQRILEPVSISKLQLSKENARDKLVIFYSHCGMTGKGRSISIKDEKSNVLKQWKFDDAATSNAGMSIPVKDLLQLETKAGTSLEIFYASQELPKGRMLTMIDASAKSMAYNNSKKTTR